MISDRLTVSDRLYTVRSATREDVPAIVALLADDVLGRNREAGDGELAPYFAAFERIAANPDQELIVVERDGAVVATLDLTILASLSRRGTLRMQIEAVRVAASERGSGLGGAVLLWAIDHARRQGCGLVQLTTDRAREDAHRFYERLGFAPTHIGYKLDLADRT